MSLSFWSLYSDNVDGWMVVLIVGHGLGFIRNKQLNWLDIFFEAFLLWLFVIHVLFHAQRCMYYYVACIRKRFFRISFIPTTILLHNSQRKTLLFFRRFHFIGIFDVFSFKMLNETFKVYADDFWHFHRTAINSHISTQNTQIKLESLTSAEFCLLSFLRFSQDELQMFFVCVCVVFIMKISLVFWVRYALSLQIRFS